MNTNERYHRQLILPGIGEEGQVRLNEVRVLVIGAGGLGCPALQYLAGAGVGTLGIIDHDVVEVSNLHRQVLFGETSLGKNKAIAAKERLQDLNAEITITAYPESLTTQNALSLFSQYDIIVDGSDNFPTRYMVNDACVIAQKPWVYGAIFKFEGQVSVFNYKNGPTYRCIYPNPPEPGEVPSCIESGVLGVLPGVVGTLQATEVLKMILGLGEVLSEKMLMYNSLTSETTQFTIKRNEEVVNKVLSEADQFENRNYEILCGLEVDVIEIDLEEALQMENTLFIDVRESFELPKIDELNPVLAPMSQLDSGNIDLDASKNIVVFCQAGVRSKKVAQQLLENGHTNVFSLKEKARKLKQAAMKIKTV